MQADQLSRQDLEHVDASLRLFQEQRGIDGEFADAVSKLASHGGSISLSSRCNELLLVGLRPFGGAWDAWRNGWQNGWDAGRAAWNWARNKTKGPELTHRRTNAEVDPQGSVADLIAARQR